MKTKLILAGIAVIAVIFVLPELFAAPRAPQPLPASPVTGPSPTVHPAKPRVIAPPILASPPLPTPTIGTPAVNPTLITANTPMPVTVTIQITDPTLIAGSANLVQLNADGTSSILGVLHDDGLNGDSVAGDHVFSIRTTLSYKSVGIQDFQVSAAFSGSLKRVLSDVVSISIISNTTFLYRNDTLGLQFSYPSNYTLQSSTSLAPGGSLDLTSNVPSTLGGGMPTGCDITVTADTNIGNLSLSDWVNANDGSGGVPSAISINGYAAIQSDSTSLITNDPDRAVFLQNRTSVLSFSTTNLACIASLESILATVTLY